MTGVSVNLLIHTRTSGHVRGVGQLCLGQYVNIEAYHISYCIVKKLTANRLQSSVMPLIEVMCAQIFPLEATYVNLHLLLNTHAVCLLDVIDSSSTKFELLA